MLVCKIPFVVSSTLHTTHCRTHKCWECQRCDNVATISPRESCSDSVGDNCITGDSRWAGSFGVNLDFVARSHCSVEMIKIEDIEVHVISLQACCSFSCSHTLMMQKMLVMQEILEKIEYFPIRCRAQLARQSFAAGDEIRSKAESKFKTKVRIPQHCSQTGGIVMQSAHIISPSFDC